MKELLDAFSFRYFRENVVFLQREAFVLALSQTLSALCDLINIGDVMMFGSYFLSISLISFCCTSIRIK